VARHARRVEPRAAADKGVVGLAEAAGPEPDEAVQPWLTEQLNGVAGEEERNVVPVLYGGAADEEPERGTRGFSGPLVR
jgi:hypothetical protein